MSESLRAEIMKALEDWVASLPPNEASAPATMVSGSVYTPLEILDHVKKKSDFGLRFLTSLCALQAHMIDRQPGASVVALIRRSVRAGSEGLAAAAGPW